MADKSDEKQIQSAVERALCTYKQNISITIDNIAANLTEAFVKNYLTLEELAARISLRTRFLENTPEYFSQLKFNRNSAHYSTQVQEFAQLRVILEENSKRLIEKLQEIHLQHEKLLNLIFKPSASDAATSDDSESDDGNVFEIISEKNIVVEPDVERRRPLFDLHSKLVKQVQATDSLEGFKTLMKRNPASATSTQSPRRLPTKNKHELERRYADSLYFFAPTTKGIKRKLSSRVSVQSKNETKMSKSMPKNIISPQVKSSSTKKTLTNQKRSSRLQLQIMGDKRNHLKCYDLLDDLDGNTLAPIKSEYPRRDNITSSVSSVNEPKTYLHTILKTKDEKVWKKLLNPVELPPQKKLSKNMSNTNSNNKVKSLMEYLTAPKHRITSAGPKTVTVLMVRVYYDNFPTKEESVTAGAVAAVDKLTDLSGDGSNTERSRVKSPEQPLRRKKVMLDHLRGLKARNDSIQRNIQKAIDVIETKMIDLLSSPPSADKNNTEAFTVMEKEIMNVLDMMSDDEEVDEKKKIKKTEKIMEPEKDNNNNNNNQGAEKSTKFQRGMTMVKNTSDKTQQVKVVKQKISERKPPKIIIQNAKLEEFKQRIFDDKKKRDEMKARKEDSEKILGQVDSVIKNIDSIHTKITETETTAAEIERKASESSRKHKQDQCQPIIKSKVKIMIDLNDGKKPIQTETKKISATAIKSPSITIDKTSKKNSEEVVAIEQPEKVIEECKKISEEEVIEKVSGEKLEATESEEVKVVEETLVDENKPEIELEPVKIAPETVVPAENEAIKEEPKVSDEIFYKKYENVMKKFQEARIYSLNYNRFSISIHYPETNTKEEEEKATETTKEELPVIIATKNNRHENILNTFYSIFFSSIFIAFNTNFVC